MINNNTDLNNQLNFTTGISSDAYTVTTNLGDVLTTNIDNTLATSDLAYTGTSLSNYISTADCISYSSYYNSNNWTELIRKMGIEKLIKLADMMNDMLIAKEDFEYYKSFIVFIVSNNVCPEDFMLKNIEYLTPEIILKKHQDLVASGKYQDLKLYIMAHN